jgi:zinc finger protein 830
VLSLRWVGHLGSKAHRTNVLRLKEEEKRKEEEREREETRLRDEQARGKRKADEQMTDGGPKKQKLVGATSDDEDEDEPDSGSYAGVPGQSDAFPADFFSDPSRAPPPRSSSDDEDDEGEHSKPVASAAPDAAVDREWEEFQKLMIAPDKQQVSHEVYQQATIIAEPVLNAVDEGLPSQGDATQVAPETAEEDEATLRARKEQEERELIMDRLMEEEQAQEEADMVRRCRAITTFLGMHHSSCLSVHKVSKTGWRL